MASADDPSDNRVRQPHEHSTTDAAGAPGASGPDDPAYGGDVQIADIGGSGDGLEDDDPTGAGSGLPFTERVKGQED